MKTLKYISFILLALLAFQACEKDDPTVIYNPENAVSGELQSMHSEYVLKMEDAAKIMDTIRWSASDFGYQASVTYTVQIDLAGNDFENAQDLLSVVGADSSEITVEVVNKAMLELQKVYLFADNVAQNVELRLKSSITTAIEPIYSQTIETQITPYVSFPETMYMIGDEFGNWDWTSTDVVDLVPVNGVEGAFWCINYFTAGKGFKWCAKKTWDNSFSELTTNTGFSQSGGNAVVDSDGLYMVYIDVRSGKIAMEPAKVYGIGDCFGSWDSGKYLFTVDGKTVSYTTTGSGELRMYATSSIATTDWWTMEFVILEGKIAYRGTGGDQDRVNVAAGKTVTLDFSSGTGVIE